MSEENKESKTSFFGQIKNQIITGASAILATIGTVFIDEIKSIAGIGNKETEQVQEVQEVQDEQKGNHQTVNVSGPEIIINIPEQKQIENKTIIIKESSEKKQPVKKTDTEKRKEDGFDW